MKARAPKGVIVHLTSALSHAKMESASFGGDTETVSVNGGEPQPLDAFIKERTRLYRQSWVIYPIERALTWARGE